MNKMKVMVIAVLMVMSGLMAMVMAVLMMMFGLMAEEVKAFDQCSGTYKTYTSEMNKKTIKIKESKLTSLRYLKKISTLVSEEPIVVRKTGKVNTVYKFKSEGIEGYLQVKNKKERLAVFKIDGKLYGRITWQNHMDDIWNIPKNESTRFYGKTENLHFRYSYGQGRWFHIR